MINPKSRSLLISGSLILLFTAVTITKPFNGDVAVLQSEDTPLEELFSAPAQSNNEFAVTEADKPDLREGLVSYWRLDQVKASKGHSIEFDGNNYIELSNQLVWDNSKGDYGTVSYWVNFDSISDLSMQIGKRGDNNNYLGFYDNLFRVQDDNSTTYAWDISPAIEPGKWHHVVVKLDSEGYKFWLNGEHIGNKTDSSTTLKFTSIGQAYGGTYPTDGAIDQVRIYNQPLSSSEIQDLYQNHPVSAQELILHQNFNEGPKNCDLTSNTDCLTDQSKNNNEGTPQNFNDNKLSTGSGWIKETPINTPSAKDYSRNQLKGFLRGGKTGKLQNFDFNASSGWTKGKLGEYALKFDGKDDYVSSDNFTLNQVTVSVWAKQVNTGEDTDKLLVSTDDETHPNSGGFSLNYGWGTDLYFRVQTQGSSNDFSVSDGATLGEWHHIVGAYDGDKLSLYVDGDRVDTNSNINGPISIPSHNLKIGGTSTGGNYPFNGSIDNVRIYNRGLNKSQVNSLYNQKPVTEGLISQWSFESGDRSTVYDTAGSQKGVLGTSAIGFEDMNKQVSVPDQEKLDLVKNFTISAWLKPENSQVFFEGFESGTMHAPWDNVDEWRIYPEGWKMDVSNHDGHCAVPCYDEGGDPGVVSAADKPDYYFINDIANGTYALYLRNSITATSPKIDLSGASSGTISGYWKGASQDGQGEHSSLEVYDGSSWVKINCIEGSNDGVINNSLCSAEDDGNWHHFRNNITQYLNKDFKIQFAGSPGSYDYTLIDNVEVEAPGAEISSFSPAILKGGNGDFGTYSIWASPSKIFGALGSPNEAWNRTNETGIYAETSQGWKNIVMTFQNSSDLVKIYVDGELVNHTQKIGEVPTSQEELRIGHRFKGKVDEVRLYNRTLSKQEIRKLNFK